ncbi:heme biosynthesis HemY N-terminal domain-containing protein [Vibrio injensis]|uniref:heme biosynthesis HemY N-terminal domain-containing protein n=1 Tax=Vibrio injensis TaxID=1307414 RepID=UPI00278C548E|nr:heme biosynthesis HemY N-terminal domain-containing protein [Vibrio injensis]
MIRLLFLLVVLGLGLFVGTQYAGQQGYVLISIANTSIEMSVTTLIIVMVALLAGLFFLEYLIKKILRASSSTWNWFTIRKHRRSRRYTDEGMIKLLEGDWKQAEKKVTRWANHHDMPLLCYLAAAEAAHAQGEQRKRNDYLALAAKQPNATLAVELTRAKQLLSDQAWQAAVDILTRLEQAYPDNLLVLKRLKQAYLALEQWQPLLALIPKLTKNQLISPSQADALTLQAQQAMLGVVATQGGSEGLLAYWQSLPKALKHETRLMVEVIEQLLQRQADLAAFKLLKEWLNKQPTTELYRFLPKLTLKDKQPLIALLQDKLRRDKNNAEAHSALGQILLHEKQWAQAQQHLEQALSLRVNIEDYACLAQALEQQDRPQAAHDVSRKALSLLTTA